MADRGTASKMSVGQFRELGGAVIRCLPDDLETDVAQGWIDNLEALREALGNALVLASAVTASAIAFKRDMRKERWELLEDIEGPVGISVGNLEIVSFLKDGERYINGEELVLRARGELRANLGQRHAEYLLEHQEEIPEEFRKYYLVFTGTIWRDRRGDRCVAYLRWRGERWDLRFGWLDDDFRSDARLVRPRE